VHFTLMINGNDRYPGRETPQRFAEFCLGNAHEDTEITNVLYHSMRPS